LFNELTKPLKTTLLSNIGTAIAYKNVYLQYNFQVMPAATKTETSSFKNVLSAVKKLS
jgi:hypothetical protein